MQVGDRDGYPGEEDRVGGLTRLIASLVEQNWDNHKKALLLSTLGKTVRDRDPIVA
jgi:hypothetical protein